MKHISYSSLVLLATGICTSGAASSQTLTATRTASPPKLDGATDDAAWKDAPELRLEAEGRAGSAKGKKVAVTLKAAYHDQYVYFLLRWQDATEDQTHRSYVWNDEKKTYEAGPDREDNAALSFPIRGKFTANMLSGGDDLWDVWHWKAQRTGPAGYAMDRTHVFTTEKPSDKAKEYDAKNGKKIWIARPEDKGDSVTKENPAPKDRQATPPAHYEAVKPSGSAADIRTGQSYKDAWWTVEFARKLNTANADDAQFTVPDTVSMGVAVFDKSEHDNHYTTGPVTLELSGK